MHARKRTILSGTLLSLSIVVLALMAAAGAGCGGTAAKEEGVSVRAGGLDGLQGPYSPKEALDLLIAGNARYTGGDLFERDLGSARRAELLGGQHPFAVVVTCSDSRVPPEFVFDQGLGDVFVVRVAGNVIGPEELGSVEYAVEHLHAPLVMVMGHEDCGAVKAALSGEQAPGSIGSLVDAIMPAVERSRGKSKLGQELLDDSIRENVHSSMKKLESSEILMEKMEVGALQIVGGEYQLASGSVELLPEHED